jgi:hypothetical protein
MWQEASFNPAEIDQELSWAEAMGMNTMRVFLHDPAGVEQHEHRSNVMPRRDGQEFVDALLKTYSILLPEQTRYLISARSIPRLPGSTTQAGCRVPERRLWRTSINIPG